MHLSDLKPENIIGAELEDICTHVFVGGRYYANSVLMPSCELLYNISPSYRHVEMDLLLVSDDIENVAAQANLELYADDMLVAYVSNIMIDQKMQSVSINIPESNSLKLVCSIKSKKAANVSLALLNPILATEPVARIVGALNDIIIEMPEKPIITDKCIVTVVDADFIKRLDTLLCSLFKNGNCNDAEVVVFAFGDLDRYAEVQKKYNIHLIKCDLISEFTFKIKTSALSIGQIIYASKYIYLDADMLILDDIHPLFDMIDVIGDDKILVNAEASAKSANLRGIFENTYDVYGCDEQDRKLLKLSESDLNYDLIVNNGVYAGSRKAILSLEQIIRSMLPESAYWERIGLGKRIFWREQGIFNLALAKGNLGIAIADVYNFQLNTFEAEVNYVKSDPVATYKNNNIKILHFNGQGRDKCQILQNHYNQLASESLGGTEFGSVRKITSKWITNSEVYDDFSSIGELELYACFIYNLLETNDYSSVLIIENSGCLTSSIASTIDSKIKITSLETTDEDPSIFLSKNSAKFDLIIVSRSDINNNARAFYKLMSQCLLPQGNILMRNCDKKIVGIAKKDNKRLIKIWLDAKKRKLDKSELTLIC